MPPMKLTGPTSFIVFAHIFPSILMGFIHHFTTSRELLSAHRVFPFFPKRIRAICSLLYLKKLGKRAQERRVKKKITAVDVIWLKKKLSVRDKSEDSEFSQEFEKFKNHTFRPFILMSFSQSSKERYI